VAEKFLRIFLLHPGQRILPVHAFAAVLLGPDEAGGSISDRAIVIVPKIVFSVTWIASHANHKKGFLHAATGHEEIVAFDAAVGEVHAKQFVEPARPLADILGARGVLGINEAFAGAHVAVGELKKLCVNKRLQAGRIHVGGAAGIRAACVEERVKLLDRRQPPVVKPAKLGCV